MTRVSPLAAAVLALGAMSSACTDDGKDVRSVDVSSGSASGSDAGGCTSTALGDTAVAVTLREFTVVPDRARVAAGRVVLSARNTGDDTHELVVVRGSDPSALPTVSSPDPLLNGTVDETKLGAAAFLGEIEGVTAGQTCAVTFPLSAGSYVLFCNIAEKHGGKVENHFQLGMRTTLTVTP